MKVSNLYLNQAKLQEYYMSRVQAAEYVPGEESKNAIVVILFEYTFEEYAHALFKLHESLLDEEKTVWLQNFTETHFLLGNPRTVCQKDPEDFVYISDAIAVSRLLPSKVAKGYVSRCPRYSPIKSRVMQYAAISQKESERLEVVLCRSDIPEEIVLIDLSHVVNEYLINNPLEIGKAVSIKFLSEREQGEDEVSWDRTRVVFNTDVKEYELRAYIREF